MENINLIETFSEFKELKNIDRVTMMSVLEDVFRGMLLKKYETDENFDIIINIDKGDFEIWRNREVVEDDELEDSNVQISLSKAKEIDEDYEVGEEVTDEVKLGDFGRRAILALRQNLSARIMELEKNHLYNKYKDRIGDVVTGEVYQVWKREILILDDEGNELILPKMEQIPSDYFRKGDTLRAIVMKVDMRNANLLIILSRTSPIFLERLFELEVPEIFDGLITIKKIVRIPGERAKVAVESYDERIDPVGACVGMKGSRVQNVVQELRGEKIDIITWHVDPAKFVCNALAPAEISRVIIDEDMRSMEVIVPDESLSIAIGKRGQNVRLASKLTGWRLDVNSETRYSEAMRSGYDSLVALPEVSISLADALYEKGFFSSEEISKGSVEDLIQVKDISEEEAQRLIEAAKKQIEGFDASDEISEEVPTDHAAENDDFNKSNRTSVLNNPEASETELNNG